MSTSADALRATPTAPPTTTERSAGAGKAVAEGDTKSLGQLANELRQLVIGYLKQETIVPLKALGRFLAWGAAGAVLMGFGGVLLVLAAIRALQVELGGNPARVVHATSGHLSGNLSWMPYVGGIVVCLAGIGLAVSRIGKDSR